jgi:2-amino-4-hydroxy-6-hydroxymethyldihydropteridine diphosphokinase
MPRVFVSVGSNIDPYNNVRSALHLLKRYMTLVGISTVYLTPAEDRPEQSRYYNCVVCGDTKLPARQFVLSVLRPIEAALGRVRTEDKYAARQIDLDLIVYGDTVLKAGDLELPAPEIRTRPYVAVPLCELSPGLTLAGSGDAVADIAGMLPKGKMEPLEQYTRLLRKELLEDEHPES